MRISNKKFCEIRQRLANIDNSILNFDIANFLGKEKAKNIVVGDYILWVEKIFEGGSFYRGRSTGKAKFVGYTFFYGEIIKDSYGQKSGQHTFSIKLKDVLKPEYLSNRAASLEHRERLRSGDNIILKKGRTLFKEECVLLKAGKNRDSLQAEKNARGNKAKIAALRAWLDNNTPAHPNYDDKRQRLDNLVKFS